MCLQEPVTTSVWGYVLASSSLSRVEEPHGLTEIINVREFLTEDFEP